MDSNPACETLLDRAFILLEDGDVEKADNICEQVLNREPKNPRAYLLKLMMELNVKREEELQNLEAPFDTNPKYQRIMQYGNTELKARLANYINYINQTIESKKLAEEKAKKLVQEQANFGIFSSEENDNFESEFINEPSNFEPLPREENEKHKAKSIILISLLSLILVFVAGWIVFFVIHINNKENNIVPDTDDFFIIDDDDDESTLTEKATETEKATSSTNIPNNVATMETVNDTVYVLYTANLREKAKDTSTSNVLAKVPFGATLSRTEKNSKWSKVTYTSPDGGSYTGYIMNDLITTNADTITFVDQGAEGVYPTTKLKEHHNYILRHYPLCDGYPHSLVMLSSENLGAIGQILGGTEVTILEVSKDMMWAKISCTNVDIAVNDEYQHNYTSTEIGYIPYVFLEISGNN